MLETGGREHCTQRAARSRAYRLGRRWLPWRNGDSESRKRWAHCIQFYNRKPLKDLSRKALAFLSLKCYSSYCMGKKETGVWVGGRPEPGCFPSLDWSCSRRIPGAARAGRQEQWAACGSGGLGSGGRVEPAVGAWEGGRCTDQQD